MWRGLSHAFEVVRLYRTFSNHIFTRGSRCVYTCSGWFNRSEPLRTFMNRFNTEKARCVEVYHMRSTCSFFVVGRGAAIYAAPGVCGGSASSCRSSSSFSPPSEELSREDAVTVVAGRIIYDISSSLLLLVLSPSDAPVSGPLRSRIASCRCLIYSMAASSVRTSFKRREPPSTRIPSAAQRSSYSSSAMRKTRDEGGRRVGFFYTARLAAAVSTCRPLLWTGLQQSCGRAYNHVQSSVDSCI